MQLLLRVKGPHADLVSHLLAKNPANVYDRQEKGHRVRMIFSIYEPEVVELLTYVTPDSFELVRNSPESYQITHYINDRAYAMSSLFCTLTRSAFSTALNGKPKPGYEEWVQHPYELEISLGPLASNLRDEHLIELWEGLGYKVRIEPGKVFYSFDGRRHSSARFLHLSGIHTIQKALQQVFVLVPVMDNYHHYYVDEPDVEKLDRFGTGWLEDHPMKEMIVRRSLRHQALIRKSKYFSRVDQQEPETSCDKTESETTSKVRLNDLRYQAILQEIEQLDQCAKIVDLGAGEGKLSVQLGFLRGIQEVWAIEPSQVALLRAIDRFDKANKKPGFVKPQAQFGSLYYYDERIIQKDVMILCEVIEHIDEDRLPQVFHMIFDQYDPKTLIVTTPNVEYNQVYGLGEQMRHQDHRFEWTRAQFQAWCDQWTQLYPYSYQIKGIGEEDEQYGHPTQMVVFHRKEANA